VWHAVAAVEHRDQDADHPPLQTQKDLPTQLLLSSKPLHAFVVLASFGSSQGYNSQLFDLSIVLDPNSPAPAYESPLRYGKLSEIHHIFRADPSSPPVVISLFFALAVLATLPVLLVSVSLSPTGPCIWRLFID
jgi:oligosaccharyltransferase complex subunit delta (ribophorin II)